MDTKISTFILEYLKSILIIQSSFVYDIGNFTILDKIVHP